MLNTNDRDYYILDNTNHLIREYLVRLLGFKPKKEELTKMNAEKLVFEGIAKGDIAGSYWEFFHERYEDTGVDWLDCGHDAEHRFTDDTVMAFAIYQAALEIKARKLTGHEAVDCYAQHMKLYAKKYPDAGYGAMFYDWAVNDAEPGRPSFGDGSAMRAGMLGVVFDQPEDVIRQAIYSALPTHAHKEGVKGAICTAVAVWMAQRTYTKQDIVQYACRCYDKQFTGEPYLICPDMPFEEMRELHTTSVTCQKAVPEAFVQFGTGQSYDETIRLSYQYDCDTDTVGAIIGGVAAAYYGETDIIASHGAAGRSTATHENGERLFLLEDYLPDEMLDVF